MADDDVDSGLNRVDDNIINSSPPLSTIANGDLQNERAINGMGRGSGVNFLCGVVEGFYGRPWTPDQRKDLFVKMNKMGMNVYLYAPKDDCKHRAFWRELYSVEEADQLTSLITAAKANNIVFCYALSPGLDITYSSAKEIACLKRKLEQVAQFGCTAFALLFDDIEPEMCESDKEAFHSFAQAQVSITNEIYQHLGQPDHFLFCPTEYCSTRAVPTVLDSEYLNTVGTKLLPAIDVMWTGCHVITKELNIKSIRQLGSILRRQPVIWDNLHANDYDQRRVFLGPFSGRSPDLIPHLRGLLTNPNCEYETNHVAVYTIGAWSRCSVDAASTRHDLSNDGGICADIRLETESSDGGSAEDIPSQINSSSYHPRAALRAAIDDWLPEFYRQKSAHGQPVCVVPQLMSSPDMLANLKLPACVNTCITSALTTTTTTTSANAAASVVNSINPLPISSSTIKLPPETPLFQPPMMNPLMNSLIPVATQVPDRETLPRDGDSDEPMDCGVSEPSTSQSPTDFVAVDDKLTFEDIQLLVDLFYLPFEHGSQALIILHDFHWLKNNVHVIIPISKQISTLDGSGSTSPNVCNTSVCAEVHEWRDREAKFHSINQAVGRLYRRLMAVPNRSLALELHPYLWDVMMAVQLLNSYVNWLGFSQGWKETFTSGIQEPWAFRGGLTTELQRLLPVENINDLCAWKAPEIPSSKTYTIRPYQENDKGAIYDVCLRTCDDGLDGTEVFSGQPQLIGDKLVGSFLTLSPEFCFVLEEEDGDEDSKGVCVGYALAALDAKQFYKRFEVVYMPHLHSKYPLQQPDDLTKSTVVDSLSAAMTPAQEVIAGFHNYQVEVPEPIYQHHPSLVRIGILSAASSKDPSLVKKLLSCLLAALKTNGSCGVYCEIHVGDKSLIEFYTKIGFMEIASGHSKQSDLIYFGRTF